MLPYLCLVFLIVAVDPGETTLASSVEKKIPSESLEAAQQPSPSELLTDEIDDAQLRALVREVLARNPGVARAEARARSALARAPQVKSLPDPSAQMTAFLVSPETRVGPQRLGVSVSQNFPWLSKLSLKERAALLGAAALSADVEAQRLELVTQSRQLALELAFVARLREITNSYLRHMIQHEEIARVRYGTGVGMGQDVIKLQAAITQVEVELLSIDSREVRLWARLNRLRDREASAPLPEFSLPDGEDFDSDETDLVSIALENRPEIEAADLYVERGNTLVELARKQYKPNFRAGLSYTLVDRRDDSPGRLNPPEGNGDDILGAQFGVSIPIWRKKLKAGVSEALELRSAAEESKRGLLAEIQAAIGDLVQRIPLVYEQLDLFSNLLIAQAEESLESAKSAYVVNRVNALDLLDAEHVLFNAQKAEARSRTDWAIATAELEGAVGETFSYSTQSEVPQ